MEASARAAAAVAGIETARSRGATTRGLRLAVLVCLTVAFGVAVVGAASAQDSKGADFWLAFPGNLSPANLSLFIAGDTATSGTVAIPGLGFSAPFTVTPGTVTTVALPNTAELNNSDVVQNKGIHVTALAEVTVYGLNQFQFTTDAYLGLPTDALGTDYINLGYKNVDVVNATQFGVVATQDSTAVTITPTVTTNGHAAGVAYVVNLNQGQTYLLRNTDPGPADLSGTIIQSTKPIGVFGGHQCANIPPGAFACDTIVEQLTPTTAWGKNFVTMPLATRTGGDTFRILASQNTTDVKLNGVTVATLNRGQLHEQIISGPAQITADKPVLVMQYSNSSTFDGVTSDPFQMMIPPYEQFLAGYTVSTPATGFSSNFVNVVTPNAAVGAVLLDGVAIPAASFTAIGASGFSGAQVTVSLGSHTLSGPLPFGVESYGYASFDSYGYPGGLSLSEIARVDSIVLAPKTATNPVNTQHCVTATVKDQNGSPLEDIRVDFAVTGANPTTGFALTNASGVAQFCYTGTNPGNDTITGTVGVLSDTAAKTWADRKPTSLVYTGATSAVNGQPATLSGTLTTNDPAPGTPLASKLVTFTLGSGATAQSCTGTTNALGSASCVIASVSQTPGSVPVTADFAGDSAYLPSSASSTVNVFAVTAVGAFVIGDLSAVPGRTVNFWGPSWARNNSLSGGSAPLDMKGFADSPTSMTCGATWTTRPGNSSAPPATIPDQIQVIVSSNVTKSGSTLSGTIARIVIVQVDPGYGPSPGRRGTGRIIATVC